MKLHNEAAPVETSGVTESSSFSIAMNAKAFRVLSDSLYQNKIGSIVREISTNAYDSHLMAGKQDVPFEIHLPNAFEPWFSVQDFGTGLSPEAIKTVFTVYFNSTKDQSNDCVGMLGLGSKTPFAYTDQFTVTSVTDGTKCIYSAYISSSGVPDIALMDESSTEEGNGVEIRMSAKREDFNRFSTEVIEQLKYFKVKPVLSNTNVKFSDDAVTCIYESDDCKVVQDNGYYNTYIIIQGNVGYHLNMDTLKKSTDAQSYLKSIAFVESFNRASVQFTFPIGSIGVTASREGVEYDKSTVLNICNAMQKLEKDYINQLKVKVNSYTTDWEKVRAFQSTPFNFRFKDEFKFPNKFFLLTNNLYALAANSVISKSFTEKVSVPSANGPTVKDIAREVPVASLCSLAHDMYRGRITRIQRHNITIEDFSKIVLIGRDKNTLADRKLRYFFNTNKGKYTAFYEIRSENDTPVKDVVAKIKTLMGVDVDTILMSEIILPEEEKTPSVRNGVTQYYTYDKEETSIRKWNAVRDVKLKDVTDSVYYITHEGNYVNFDELRKSLVYLNNLNLDPKEYLIAISASKEILIKDNINFKDFQQLKKDSEKVLLQQKSKLIKNYRRYVALETFDAHLGKLKFLSDIERDAPYTDVAGVYKLSKKVTQTVDKTQDMYNIKMKLETIGVNTDQINKSVSKRVSRVCGTLKKYPLLEALSSWYIRDEVKAADVVQYVKALHSTI